MNLSIEPDVLTCVDVYSDKTYDFVATPVCKVTCPECGERGEDMYWDQAASGEPFLVCGSCGEQFFLTKNRG